MSVLITLKVKGDTDKFRKALTDRADEFAKVSQSSRDAGAIHHRFGVGEGYILVVDEWETPEQFQKFFMDPKLQAFIGEIGGDTSSPPDMTITEAVESSDQF